MGEWEIGGNQVRFFSNFCLVTFVFYLLLPLSFSPHLPFLVSEMQILKAGIQYHSVISFLYSSVPYKIFDSYSKVS